MSQSSIRPSKMVFLFIFWERASVPLLMFSAKQGNYWYRFITSYSIDLLYTRKYSDRVFTISFKSVCESLWPKQHSQFLSHLNETCYTWFIWCEDVHNIFLVIPCPAVTELCPFENNLIVIFSFFMVTFCQRS